MWGVVSVVSGECGEGMWIYRGLPHRHNQMDLVTSASIWLERGEPLSPELVGMSPRVGIDYAGPEWASAPLRFFQTDCASISRPRTRKRQDKPSS